MTSPPAVCRAPKGFTLIELIIVLAVAAVLVAAAAPSLDTFVRNSRVRGEGLRLLESLAYARVEAVKRQMPVVVCQLDVADIANSPACDGMDGEKDWAIFSDANGDLVFDSGTDVLLRVIPASPSGVERLHSLAGVLVFDRHGNLKNGSEVVFGICSDRDGDGEGDGAYGRELRVSPVGRAWLKKGTVEEPVTCDPNS